MMLPQKDKEPDLAFVGLVILILFGFLILHDSPIKSSRPLDPTVTQTFDLQVMNSAYESWLWDDPFREKLLNNTDKDKGCESLRNRIVDIQNNGKSVEIFAALLEVNPNTTENKESRIRHRYATIAGLIEGGYSPSKPDRLQFCNAINTQSAGEEKQNVRWEHYYHASKPDVITLWLDNNVFNARSLLDKQSKASKFLESLITASKKCTSIKNNLYIFDWSYTNLDWSHHSRKVESIQNTHMAHKKLKSYYEPACKSSSSEPGSYPKEIIRPLRVDKEHSDKLIQKLTDELIKYRRIKALSEIAIITEQDTQYVRELSENFSKKIKSELEDPSANKFKRFSYFKGLDAYQQILAKKEKNNEPQNLSKYLSPVDIRNPPFGEEQFDYLHRMAIQIKGDHKAINTEKRIGGIKAVVVFSSDFYDKLIILEALRSEMPNILILTTDLDARMFHPQYFRWTRNLVVASFFGLQLPQDKQNGFSAFRDSQQTEIFYNTKRLLDKNDEHSSPLLFEVGRNGPVFLSQSESEYKLEKIKSVLPEALISKKQKEHQLYLLIVVTVALIFLLYGFRPDSIEYCIFIIVVALVVFVSYYRAIDINIEPLSFTDGVSLWPTIFIQIIAFALAFLYFSRIAFFRGINLKDNILQENFKNLQNKKLKKDFLNEKDLGKEGEEKFLTFVSPVTFLILFISIFVYAYNDVKPDGFIDIWRCTGILAFFILLYIVLDCSLFKRYLIAITHWASENKSGAGHNDTNNKLEVLWNEYYKLSQCKPCLIRITMMWLIFALIETILFYLMPSWPQPVRGDYAFCYDWLISISSFILIMLLTFYVLDAYRLSYYFIKKLRVQFLQKAECKIEVNELEDIVGLVAERTRVVDSLIYYPLICIILMLFARITYFDNQDFPYSKAVSFGASISLLLFAGFMIRSEAEKLKITVIKIARKDLNEDCKVGATIEKIGNIKDGVFQPMLEQPVMRALLLILATTGILAAEYIMIFA